MRAAWLGLLLFVLSGASFALDPPDHDKWQAGMTAAKVAIGAKDSSATEEAIVAVFEQAMRMPDRDPRVVQSGLLVEQAMQTLDVLDSSEYYTVLTRLNSLTKVPGGLGNPASWGPATALADKKVRDRDFAGARAILADMAKRATTDFGPSHAAVRTARRQEASIAALEGDYDAALALLNEGLDSTRRVFGEKSSEYVEVVISIAEVQMQREDFAQAATLANEALQMLTLPQQQSVAPILSLGALFEGLGNLSAARDLYQRGDLSDTRRVGDPERSVMVVIRLARLNARLGDGAAARTFMNRATEIGRSMVDISPGAYLEALCSEATLYSYVGRYERAVESLERGASLLPSMGDELAAYARLRLSGGYLIARKFDRALALAEESLRAAKRGSDDYATAAAIAAYAAAQKSRPAPRTALAQEAVDVRRKLDPRHEPYRELGVLAASYAAEGRWKESLALQQRIIDEETAKRGRYQVGWNQWRDYAKALEHAGRKREAQEILARVTAEIEPLAAALSDGSAMPQGIYVSERSAFGFNVDLADSAWRRWTLDPTAGSFATFAAQFHGDPGVARGSLFVIPLLLPDGFDIETGIAGLLQLLEHDRGLLKPWSKGSLHGYEYRFSRSFTAGNPADFFCRLLVDGQHIYLVMASGATGDARSVAAAEAALDAVALTASPDPKALGDDQRDLQSRILARVAATLVDRGRYDDGLTLYEAARQFHVTDALLEYIIFAYVSAGRFEAARDAIGRYPGGPAADPRLFLVRAYSHEKLGDKSAALADYQAGFAAGARNDNYVSEYVSLLLDQNLGGQAVEFLDGYAAVKESPDVLALQALVSFRLADAARLSAAFEALEDPQQSSAPAALLAGLLHKQRGGPDEVQAFVTRIPDKLKSAELYFLLATAQVEAKLPNEAAKTVTLGLVLAPNNENLKRLERLLKAQQGPVL